MFGPVATLVVALVVVGTALTAAIAAYAHRNVDAPAATAFRDYMLAAALWGLTDLAIFLSPPAFDGLWALAAVDVFASGLATVLLIRFVAAYTQSPTVNRRWVQPAIWGVLAVVTLLWLWNPAGIAYHELTVETYQGITTVVPTFAPFWLAYVVYVYGLLVVAFAVLVSFMLEATNVYRKQTALVTVSILPLSVGSLGFLFGVTPAEGLNPSVVLISIQGVIIWMAIYRYEFLSVMPLAKDAIVEMIDDPVLVFDADEQLAFANDATGRFDVSSRDLASELDAVLPGVSRALADDDVYRFASADEPTDGGAERIYKPSATTITDQYGKACGRVIVMHDITAQKRREQRLGEFASIVSHDLRNPLNVAEGRLDMARETGDPEHFDEVEASLDRMETLIDDLLSLARTGSDDGDREPVGLAATAERAWEHVDTGGSTLSVDIADEIVVASESQLVELFENLFRNAVEHNPDPVEISVGTTADGFYVADDGVGFPGDERERVLERGFTTSADGTGLGLHIVGRIADAHGWTTMVTDSETGGARIEFEDSGTDSDAADR